VGLLGLTHRLDAFRSCAPFGSVILSRCSDAGNKQVLLVAITTSCDCIMSGREGGPGLLPCGELRTNIFYERGWRHVACVPAVPPC
jgi:hypothetical protein